MTWAGERWSRSVVGPWIDEFRDQLRSLRTPAQPWRPQLTVFEQLDDRLMREGLDRAYVLDQIQNGIYGVRRIEGNNPGRPNYRLDTERLTVNLHTEPWSSNQSIPLAVLDRAQRRRTAVTGERAVVFPGPVTVYSPRDGARCDLEELVRQVEDQRWITEAEHALTRVTLTPQTHARLRGEVLLRYGSLRALLELSKQRAELAKTYSTGTVLDSRLWFGPEHDYARELAIRVGAPGLVSAEEGSQYEIRLAEDMLARPLRMVLIDYVDDVAVMASRDKQQRSRQALTPGTPVAVSEADGFRYRRHLLALRDFLDEYNVVGNWTSLALLLCRPQELAAPGQVPEIVPSARPLNPQQCAAVAGALATPHAFFVQGPPGTGKTQVITEIAGRLVARGERVLMTAPTHVALDEVLSRLADEPGVLPLRLSYSDDKVDRAVRRFTRNGYDSMVADQVRVPATSSVAGWQDRLGRVSAQRTVSVAWQEASDHHQGAEARLAAATLAKQRNDQVRSQHYAALEGQLSQAARLVDWHAGELARLDATRLELERRGAALVAHRSALARLLDRVGLGAVARLNAARRRLERRMVPLRAEHQAAAWQYHQQHLAHQQATSELARQEQLDQAQVVGAHDTLARVIAQLDTVRRALQEHSLGHLAADRDAVRSHLAGLEQEEHRLTGLVEMQQRWFDLLGLEGHEESADRTRARSVVGPALTSAINLVCVTTTGFGGDKDYRELDYDTLIVDEASKVTAADFLIPARRARRWMVVGDEKQLPPYVEPADEHHLHAMAALHLSERDTRYTLKQAVDHLAALWRTVDDDEQHPFRKTSVEAIAAELQHGRWKGIYRKTYSEQMRHISSGEGAPESQLLQAMHEHQVTSLFERSVGPLDEGLRCRLIEQRRMPAQIARLVKDPVYAGDYRTPEDDKAVPQPLVCRAFPAPVVFLDTSMQPAPGEKPEGTSAINRQEADWVREVCRTWNRELVARNAPAISVSVLAFYGAQAKLLRKQLGYPRFREFTKLNFKVVDSVDRIQGQESDLVIVSFCRTFGTGEDGRLRNPNNPNMRPNKGYARWLQNINRLNVACTRAKRQLILVGHGNTLRGLNGVRAAEGFYKNLFALVDSGDGGILLQDLKPLDTWGRRK